ncbi:hypothetical protein MesoLjLc_51780 [Mesorhizobium sp. L-8-10]|uniref:hypothetical protein n=1 Tax=Mesorhizobium sp. L-8-10 TaxID=2744523 RepID=UPI001925BCC2|nr:hypothetical protein [Mesorhizobium sp. L-8-10]BCH33248.1 hypothetical protein MesoLjLc_51780 [Mesorhizobium sp. L-8-10]
MSNELTIMQQDGTDVVEADFFAPASIFDVERFEMVMRVAEVMARATTLPDHLKSKSQNPEERYLETRGNCFMIANQASNWKLDPFAVAQASAFVYGKLVLEGKLVRAVIRKFLGFDLCYSFFGDAGTMERRVYVSDKPFANQDGKALSEPEIEALMKTPGNRITRGTLKKWHSKNKEGGVNDNWNKDEEKMFRERGAREWCREFSPGLMLGVYTPDEFDEVEHTARSSRARDITAASNPLLDNRSSVPMERVDQSTGEVVTEAAQQRTAENQKTNSSSPSTTAPRTQGDDRRGDAQPKTRLPAEIFRKYASSICRMQSADNIRKAHAQFWQDYQKPQEGTADHQLAAKILNLNNQRVEGKIPAEGLMDEIEGIIHESFGGL